MAVPVSMHTKSKGHHLTRLSVIGCINLQSQLERNQPQPLLHMLHVFLLMSTRVAVVLGSKIVKYNEKPHLLTAVKSIWMAVLAHSYQMALPDTLCTVMYCTLKHHVE